MIERVVAWCAAHKTLVGVLSVALAIAGWLSMRATPIDAIPDLSDTQVIITTEWGGRSPDLIEDQVTAPLVNVLLSTPGVRTVRAVTEFGVSYVYVVFEDGVDLYWARTRVSEQVQRLRTTLPAGAVSALGPDATGVGWIYQYALVDETGQHDLASLRSLQDWHLRSVLAAVDGVAEVATIGGFVKQYQVTVDPVRLEAYGLAITDVADAIRRGSGDAEGRLLEFGGREFTVRARAYLGSVTDIEDVALKAAEGASVRVRDVADVRLGPDMRRGAAELDGRGEVVGGIVIMRVGENARTTVARVKEVLAGVAATLPQGVRVVPVYDRSRLVDESLATLRRTLIEEMLVVAAVVILFLGHLRSALVPILVLPIAVLAAFLPMYAFGVSANIMSLGGLALAVGVVVDAAIVMVENAYRRLSEPRGGGLVSYEAQPAEIARATAQIARPLVFSLAIIVVSFAPVFLLEAREGRLFRPLAVTKTSAMLFATLLSITLVPALLGVFVRGRTLRPQASNPLNRVAAAIYEPLLRFALRWRRTVIGCSIAAVPLTIPLALSVGSEFMPALYEGTMLFMPTSRPGLSITEATRLLQVQDRVLREIPEVAQVFGSVGRGTSATDNSPMGMVNTTIELKPRGEWRPGLTFEALQAEMDAAVQVPGLPNVWTQPIRSRLDMLSTGMQTVVGIKVFGTDLVTIDAIGRQIERVVRGVPGTRSVYAERVAQGMFTDLRIDREALQRHGLAVADVQNVVQTAIGGSVVAETVEGRERYPISVRYARAFRDDLPAIERVFVTTPSGARVALGDLATIANRPGPAMIRNEDGRLTGYVYIDTDARDLAAYVDTAQRALVDQVALPSGYTWEWTGDYASQSRARERLRLVVPLVLGAIFLLLWATFRSVSEAMMVMLSVVYAMTGGVVLQWMLGYRFSVAVWVGYIALFGVAVQTGVVMIMYLREALESRRRAGVPMTQGDLLAATLDGAILRLRPKLMTVSVVLASLLPLMWSQGAGADLMKPIAAPIIGGMITSAIHVLIVTPVIFYMMNLRHCVGSSPDQGAVLHGRT